MRIRGVISFGLLLIAVLLLAAQCPNGNQYAVALTASPTSGTAPLPVNFDASSSFAPEGSTIMCEWVFGDGGSDTTTTETISHTYLHPGTYTAELTGRDTEGNSDSDSCTITVTAAIGTPPSASFTATPTFGQAPLTVNFNGFGSSDSDGSITSYSWAFGDGGSSSGVTASHTYSSAGIYTAQLTVTDNDGATDSSSRTIQVSAAPVPNAPPTASFTATPTSGQAPLAVGFNASGSSDSDGSITSYAWSFGDGGSSSGATASHTYSSAGTYTAQLTVTDDDGSTDSTTQAITVAAAAGVNAPPTASFTASPMSGPAPLLVAFDASGSSDPDDSINRYSWIFGDGVHDGSTDLVTTSHTYTIPGIYSIQLEVEDEHKAKDTTTIQIEVFAPSGQEAPAPTEAAQQQSGPAATPGIQSSRATAKANDATDAEPADAEPTQADSVEADPAPADQPETLEPIPAAEALAIPDCNAFDISAFNAIIDGTFSFITQDQLNNCHFESDNDFRLLIGGGKPSSSEEMQTQFNSTFGAIPGSSWEAIDDFYLGMSFSSASVSAQGVSASGHSIVVVAAAQPGSDPDVLKQIFTELARESARQLNHQW